jgi:hypothetical protein
MKDTQERRDVDLSSTVRVPVVSDSSIRSLHDRVAGVFDCVETFLTEIRVAF